VRGYLNYLSERKNLVAGGQNYGLLGEKPGVLREKPVTGTLKYLPERLNRGVSRRIEAGTKPEHFASLEMALQRSMLYVLYPLRAFTILL